MTTTPRWYLISMVVLFVSLVGLGVYTAVLQSSLSSDITDVEDRFSADLAAVDEKLSASIAEVEQELSTGIESLRTENTALLAGIGDVVASQILGEWSRDVPQQERIGNQFQALRESVLEPEGGAASQLNRALVRTANIGSLLWIAADMQGQSETRQLQILNQCLEFLLAINNVTTSCNLEPISP